MFVLFSLLCSTIGTLLWFCFPVCALVSFVFNWLIFFCFVLFSLLTRKSTVLFLWTVLVLFIGVCVCVCVFHYFCYCLPDFVFAICMRCIFCCFCVCFNPIKAITNYLCKLHSPARDQAVSFWNGSIDSKTLDFQQTPNPREY